MTNDTPKIYEQDFFLWFSTWLKDKGLQFSKCGFKTGKGLGSRHEIDLTTGFWKEPTYSTTKPPRWLYQIEIEGDVVRAVSPETSALNLGAINAAQEDKAGVVFRLAPLVRQEINDFLREDGFEVHALFVFPGATPKGSSSEPFNFDTSSGVLRFKGKTLPYIAAGLLGIHPRDTELEITSGGQLHTITYGDVIEALGADIKATPEGGETVPMPVFDLSREDELDQLKRTIVDAWAAGQVKSSVDPTAATEDDSDDDDGIVAPESLQIPENTDLHGIDPSVYRQINAALASGKQHIMLYGPPGTGKTTLARWIASTLTGGQWTLITGSSDWSSQDIIGGYQPVGSSRSRGRPRRSPRACVLTLNQAHKPFSSKTRRQRGEKMAVNVQVETVINRSRSDVAGFAMNADNDPVWIGGITQSRTLTEQPMGKGTQVERVAKFLGRRIEYVNEGDIYDPEKELLMHSVKGPFPMTVRYQFEDAADGTLARIQVSGDAGGFYRLVGPVLAQAVKRSVRGDLRRLKRLLESETGSP